MEKTAEEVIEDLDGKILSKLDIDANGRLHTEAGANQH